MCLDGSRDIHDRNALASSDLDDTRAVVDELLPRHALPRWEVDEHDLSAGGVNEGCRSREHLLERIHLVDRVTASHAQEGAQPRELQYLLAMTFGLA